jgi:membrane fusion protein
VRALFRPEAIEAQREQWLGSVQLVRPLSLWLLTAGAALVAAAILAFLVVGQNTRKATIPGVLVPDRGLIRIVAPSAGTVVERRVAEGDSVAAGDTLFVVALERRTMDSASLASVRRSLDERRRSLLDAASRERELAATQDAALDSRLGALRREAEQAEAEIALQRQRLALAEASLARFEALGNQEFISQAQVQTKREEVLGVRAALQSVERQRAVLARERAELEGRRRELPLVTRSVQGGIERELASLEREAAELDATQQVVVRAPQDGTVSAVFVEPGQSVSPESALAGLVPRGATLRAQLYAPSSAIGFVRPEQPVRLRFEAFPYQRFGQWPGRVVEVSRIPLTGRELAALSLPAGPADGQPMFRISVALGLPPRAEPLPLVAGMRLQADVMLERRRLVEWLFAPLAGLGSRL